MTTAARIVYRICRCLVTTMSYAFSTVSTRPTQQAVGLDDSAHSTNAPVSQNGWCVSSVPQSVGHR